MQNPTGPEDSGPEDSGREDTGREDTGPEDFGHEDLGHQDVAPVVTDPELERMLEDAYDVPAVPRSLLERLDRAVEQQWGVSPELSRREPSTLVRVASRGSRLLTSWPLAASLALVIVMIVAFQSGVPAYGWAQMLEALHRAEVVQVASSDGATVRWMSVAGAVLGERSASRSRLLDFNRGIMLQHKVGEEQISRRTFTRPTSASPQEAVVIAFLLGNLAEDGDSLRSSELSVLDESWSSAGNEVILRVKLGSPGATAELNIALDRETHLPTAFERAGQDLPDGQFALSYPDTDATQLLSQDFPADLAVIDAGPAETALAGADRPPQSARVASVDQPSADQLSADPPSADPPSEDQLNENPPNESQPGEALAVAEEKAPGEQAVGAAAPVGAASLQWKPVKATELSVEDAVAQINSTLEVLWKRNNLEPAEAASDEELLRRVYLDLAGRTPSVSEVRAYLADESSDRYAKLVDGLLASRDHTTHMATVWRTYLIPEGIDLARFGGTESFEDWIGKQFAEEVPYDEIVRRLLFAEGRLTQSGPLLFYAAVKLDPDQLAARSARVFLGMRLDCAQCHDDHFEPWLQEDFWGYAAFFAQISRPQGVLRDVSTVMRVRDIDRGEVKLPESETIVPPRFLDGSPLDDDAASVARRRQLAGWLTAADNPYFARAAANRVWGQLFGKGIVDPVDGFGQQHEPVSQELLDQLAGHFLSSGYNLRELFRTIVLSRAYRLSSGAESPDPKRLDFFAQMNVKLLTAEQMYDCITVASMLGSAETGSGFNLARTGNSNRDQFLQQFRAPPGRSTEYQSGIPQALTLMNGGLINDATGLTSSGLLKSLEAPFISNEQRIEILYLATLSRRLTSPERELLKGYVGDDASGAELQEPLADVLWALLNSAEFTMNH